MGRLVEVVVVAIFVPTNSSPRDSLASATNTRTLAEYQPCDVTDGSRFSSTYPCTCGAQLSVCSANQACNAAFDLCVTASQLAVTLPGCATIGVHEVIFSRAGETMNG